MAFIHPDVWFPFAKEAMVTKPLIQSFNLVETSNLQDSKTGDFWKMPYKSSFKTVATLHGISNSTTITPNSIGDIQETSVVMKMGDGISTTRYDDWKSGINTIDMVKSDIVPVFNEWIQDYLISLTKGCFAVELATSNTYDGSGDDLSPALMMKATQAKFGEMLQKFETLIMHSMTYAKLVSDYASLSGQIMGFTADLLYKGELPTFMGKRILINDSLATTTSTYMTFGKPWFLAKDQLDLKAWQDPATGGGTDLLFMYLNIVPHLKGMKYTNTTPPSEKITLETGSNWSKVAQTENIGILKIEHLQSTV